MRVLIEPKNAVTRQFQKFLQLDKVELVFTDGAIEAAAEVALDRKTGARALRSIVEESLLEVMFDIPERTDVRKCIITEETIRERPRAAAADQVGGRQGRRRDQLRGVDRRSRRDRVVPRPFPPSPGRIGPSPPRPAASLDQLHSSPAPREDQLRLGTRHRPGRIQRMTDPCRTRLVRPPSLDRTVRPPFLLACAMHTARLPDAKGWLMGVSGPRLMG